MVHFQALLLSCLAVGQSSAHFLMHSPPSLGFDETIEGEAPCGGFAPDFSKDNVTNFGVGGDAIVLTSTHPQATWLFRATLDMTASGNWTDLLPAIQQSGLGAYCEPGITVPASWAGSKGIIGVVMDAPDGTLYQCAAVNFIAGAIPAPSTCTNVTGLSAVFTTNTALSSLPTSFTSTATGFSTATMTSSTTSSSGTATTKASAATAIGSFEGLGSLAWAGMLAFAGLTAFLL